MPVPETATCPLCGSPGTPVFKQRDLSCGCEGEFEQSRCAACDLFFLSSRVPETEIHRYYPATYTPWRPVRYSSLIYRLAGALAIPQKRRRRIQRFIAGGRILDVGCGTGAFLAALDDAAWRKFGMDVTLPVDIPCAGEFHTGYFDREPVPMEAVHAITMWHVFEHLYHPLQALRNAAAILRPEGYLFISIPNPHSFDARLFGRFWCGWDVPRHIATYSRAALSSMLERAGFRLHAVVPESGGVDWCFDIGFLLKAFGHPSRLHESLVLRVLLSPLAWLSNRFGRSGSTLYVARRAA